MGCEMAYKYKYKAYSERNYKLLAYLILIFAVLGFGYAVVDMAMPTGKVIDEGPAEFTCPPCNTTADCPEITCPESPDTAELSFTSEIFEGIRNSYTLYSDIGNEEITFLDMALLHKIYLDGNYGREKITYTGAKMQGDDYGIYFCVPSGAFNIGTYMNKDLNKDWPHKVYFLSEERWILEKNPSEIIFGNLLVNTTKEAGESDTINDIDLSVTGLTQTQINVELDGVSAVIEKEKMKQLSGYYVFVKDISNEKATVFIFENSERIADNDFIDTESDFKYFITTDSFGLVNHRELKLYTDSITELGPLSINLTLHDADYENMRIYLLDDADDGDSALEISTENALIKTGEGYKKTIYAFGPNEDYCFADPQREDSLDEISSVGTAIPRSLNIDSYTLVIKEQLNDIRIRFDLADENKITSIRVTEPDHGPEIISNDDFLRYSPVYTPFGSVINRISEKEIEISFVKKQKIADLIIGKTTTETENLDLTIGDEVNIQNTNIKLTELKS